MPLTYVGMNAAAADNVALPTFQAGDLAIAFAYRSGSTTVPSALAGWTDVATSGGANTNSRRIAYRVLQTGDTTAGSFTNATAIQVIVLRGQEAGRGASATQSPIGAVASGGSNTTTMTLPALTVQKTDGSSWLIGFGGSKGTTANAKDVTAMVRRSGAIGALGLHTLMGVTGNFSATAYSSVVDVAANRMDTVEVLAEPTSGPVGAPMVFKIRQPILFRVGGGDLPKVGPAIVDYGTGIDHEMWDARARGEFHYFRRQGGPLLPKTGPHPITVGTGIDHEHYDIRAQGSFNLIQAAPPIFVPPAVPNAYPQAIVRVAEDILSQPRNPDSFILGGKPNVAVTPRSLRSTIIGRPPDETIATDIRFPGAVQIQGGEPNSPVTPRSLRPVVIQPAEDIFSNPKHPEGRILGGQPNKATTPQSLRPMLVATAEELKDWLLLEGKATVRRVDAYGIYIPPYRPILSVPQEDVLTREKWPPSQILGGKPSRSVTPRQIRPLLYVPQEDALSQWKWPLSQQFGGRPSRVVTPRSLRPILTVLQRPEEVLQELQAAPTQLYKPNVLTFGQSLSVITRGFGQFSRVRFVPTAGFFSQASAGSRPTFMSLQTPWQELLEQEINKTAIAKVTPRQIFPSPPKTFQIASTDPFLIVQHETPTRILGGKPNRGVTVPTLRDIVYNFGEDNFFFVDYAPSVSAGDQRRPQSPPPPPLPAPGPAPRVIISKRYRPQIISYTGANPPISGIRNLLLPVNPYDADSILNALYHGRGTVLGGRAGENVTKPILRSILAAAPPDESILFNPQSKGVHWLWQGKAIVAFTPPTLRTPLYVPVEEVSQYELWPPSYKIGGRPHTETTPTSQVIAKQITVIPEDDFLPMTNAGNAKLFRSPAPDSMTPPSKREVLFASTPDVFTPQVGPIVVHWTRSFTAPGVLPKIPLPIKYVPAEDVLSAYIAPSTIQGGKPNRETTPPTLREVLFNFAEDAFFFTNPSGDNFSPQGGKPSSSVTILTRRPVLIASTPDVLSPERNPEGVILGGKPSREVTPFTLRRPLLAFVEDVFSLPRHAEGIILGGKPNRSVTPRTLRSPILVLAEDVYSTQRHPESYRFGGISTFRVTTPILRKAIVIRPEDVLSTQRHPEAMILGGRPNIEITPATLRQLLTVPAEDVLSELRQSQALSGGFATEPLTRPTLRQPILIAAEDIFSLQNHPYAWILGGKFGTVPIIGGVSVWGWIPPPREIAWRVPGTEIVWIIDSETQWEPPTE